MGNSQYWTSFWVVGLIILLCFFCLFLGAQVFVFFYDRISTFEIWNSPIWLKLKIPLIVLGVIVFLAAAITLSRYQGQREMKVAQDYAQTQAILREHMQKPLYNPVSVTIGPGGAVVLTGQTAEPERLQDLLVLTRKLESAVK